jgi:putative spermidine/putrescine transport system permease protein
VDRDGRRRAVLPDAAAATVEFSLKMRRGEYSFDAYRVVLTDPHFQASFGYSIMMGVFAIVLGVLLVVPTAYWVQLRLPKLRPLIEFITLLPLVIPAIVIVFGYLHIYNSSSFLPLTGNERATDFLLICSAMSRCVCPTCTARWMRACAPSMSAR